MLQSIGYAPYLRSKAAEVSAYRTLAPNVKDVCFPIFGLRPWQNANHLRKTIEKIVEAVGPRPFGLGLDDTAFGQGSSKPAQAEFDALFNSYRGYSGYYDFVSEIENAIPVLVPANSSDALLIQLGNAQSLDRGLVIHQRHNANVPISNYLQQFSDLPSDTIFVVDVGWAPRNMLQMAAWAGSQIQRIIEVAGDAEIVVMGSGFPDSFSHIVGNDDVTIIERQLFAQIRQVYQQANLTFGDWASTRLPQSGAAVKYLLELTFQPLHLDQFSDPTQIMTLDTVPCLQIF